MLLIISENTAKYVEGVYPLWELDNIAVKGKKEPVRIFAIEEATTEHKLFLDDYYAGNWTKALKSVPVCKAAKPEMAKYYDAMADRLSEGVPKVWNGFYVATSK